MAEPIPTPTPEEIRADLVARIGRIERHLDTGLTESREEDEQAKWNLSAMEKRLGELRSQLAGMDAGPAASSQVRSIRVISSKGY